MSRLSPGERTTMHLQRKSEPYGQDVENTAYCAPHPINAIDVRPGMVVSERPTGPQSVPRKVVVRTVTLCDKYEEHDGKLMRLPAVFFNGNGRRKYRYSDVLLCLFATDAVRDGRMLAHVPQAERQTTDEEKAENRARHAAEKARMAELIARGRS